MMAVYLAGGILGVVALIWLSRHREISRGDRLVPRLSSGSYPGSVSAGLPRISVIVAAKDEEASIERCVRSWLTQDYPDFEVIVVNDRSGDRTGTIIDALAGEDARVRPVHVTELRAGWFGKNNAMREGVARASGAWLCFSDADCWQTSARSLSVAMADARQSGADFLSVLPVLETCSVWERIIQPACGAVMMLWFNPLKVNDPRSSAAYANGAFMLMSLRAYEAIGGHEPVRAEVNEDVHMARRAKEAGLRLRVASNTDLYRVRMYDGFRQAWRGWSRIFYGCFGTLGRLLASLGMVTLLSLSPWLVLLGAAAVRLTSGELGRGGSIVAFVAAAAGMMQLTVIWRFYSISRLNPLLSLTYPFGAAIASGMLISAIRRLGGRGTTTWRGTTYRGDRVESGQPVAAK
ncbi:MAG: glycosyltransferase [Phycisphaerae bacterium]|nr:glycosyltransferase [Phycisphaerae bacterium]